MPSFTQEGSYRPKALVVGDWAEIKAKPTSGSFTPIGSCHNGVLAIAKETYAHKDTSFPRRTDQRWTISFSATFEGDLAELTAENLALALGKSFSAPGNYLYLGLQEADTYFTLHGTRRRKDRRWCEFHLFKCAGAGNVEIGGGDEAVTAHLTAEALDDEAGDYGGSSAMPLGWISFPTDAQSA